MLDTLNLHKALLAFSVLMCTGCMSVGPIGEPGFSRIIHRDLAVAADDRAVITSRATLLQGTYGYKGQFQAIFSGLKGALLDGVLVCTNERLVYSVWDDEARQYIALLDTPYSAISNVTVKEFGLGKRLVVLANGAFFTFEITGDSGLGVDAAKTLEIYNFALRKLQQARS